jgi:hypothetical protein
MTPNAALRHAWLRRRLPRPPAGTGEVPGKVDSPSGTLRTPNSTASRTSSQSKLNAVTGSAKMRADDGRGGLRSEDIVGGSTRHTKLPQIPNTIA